MLLLIAQILLYHTSLSKRIEWFERGGFPFSAMLVSAEFFFSAMNEGAASPNDFIAILFAGVFLLAASLIILGIGLIRNR